VVVGGYFDTLAGMRKPYPTDVSDAEWNYIEPHMPAPNGQKYEDWLKSKGSEEDG
jgi:hypothetical protein